MHILTLAVQVLLAAGMILVSWWLWHDDDGGVRAPQPVQEPAAPVAVASSAEQAA